MTSAPRDGAIMAIDAVPSPSLDWRAMALPSSFPVGDLGVWRLRTPGGTDLRFALFRPADDERIYYEITGTAAGIAGSGRGAATIKNPFDIAGLIAAEGGDIVGKSGKIEVSAAGGEISGSWTRAWTVEGVDAASGRVRIDLGGGELTYEASKDSGGDKCETIVNVTGFAVGVILAVGGLILNNGWIVASGAGLMITFGGRLAGGGGSFMDPGDGNWQPGVSY